MFDSDRKTIYKWSSIFMSGKINVSGRQETIVGIQVL